MSSALAACVWYHEDAATGCRHYPLDLSGEWSLLFFEGIDSYDSITKPLVSEQVCPGFIVAVR